MVKLVYSKCNSIQEVQNNQSNPTENTESIKSSRPHLKLVVSNPDPMLIKGASKLTDSGLMATVCANGPNIYEMALEDPRHPLKCDLLLEIDPQRVICHFPLICGEELNTLVEEDETLYGIIMIQFQMKILEQLLLFCSNHDASHLVVYTDDDQAICLDIYEDFLTSKDQVLTPGGEKTKMIIAADMVTFDSWIDYMAEVNLKFRQTLWQDQRFNLAIKRYLKTYPLNSI